MFSPTTEFDAAARALTLAGWCTLDGLMSSSETEALADECAAMQEDKLLLPARVGGTRDINRLRGDYTRWFEHGELSAIQQQFCERIDTLRVALSRQLMLGLVDSESHYALYPPGSGYGRHLDQLRHSDARVLSAVFYLNQNWHESEGGALRLYLANGASQDIYPRGGTLLLFLSAQFEHEVLPATRRRMSIACWMRQRSIGLSD